MSASGQSLKTIAKALNRDCVSPPRPRAGKHYATWCPTCIRAMLRRELYAGKVIWNSSRFVKVPGTNKRVRRMRPESEWRTMLHPELQIVSDELWRRVKERQESLLSMYGGSKRKGLLPRSVTSPCLLSGLLKCGLCGANLIIVTGYGSYSHYPSYGCSQHFNRGACSNAVLIRRDWAGERLLDDLQKSGAEARGHRLCVGEVRPAPERCVFQAFRSVGSDARAQAETGGGIEAACRDRCGNGTFSFSGGSDP